MGAGEDRRVCTLLSLLLLLGSPFGKGARAMSMLSRQSDGVMPLSQGEIDPENPTAGHPTHHTKSTNNSLKKRQHNLLSTPRTTANTTNPIGFDTKTPKPGQIIRPPSILRDITNSANPPRFHAVALDNDEDVHPVKIRVSGPSPLAKPRDSNVTNNNSEAIASHESRSQLSQPPFTIEELLALPDDQLPEIEFAPPPTLNLDNNNDFSDMPPIIDLEQLPYFTNSIKGPYQYNSIQSHTCREKLSASNDCLVEAIRQLAITPEELAWAYEPLPPLLEVDDEHCPPCLMFDNLPEMINTIETLL